MRFEPIRVVLDLETDRRSSVLSVKPSIPNFRPGSYRIMPESLDTLRFAPCEASYSRVKAVRVAL